MRKKEEFESARLMDFDFRQRARAIRLLAQTYKLDEGAVVRKVAILPKNGIIEFFLASTGRSLEEVSMEYTRCLSEARKHLIVERGDPTPNRLG